ncbi:MAG: dihydrofolate reductase [Oscillospiraceae bacterium]|nr:dihydrofolate reductase [Oscillospiraceae bacterium]
MEAIVAIFSDWGIGSKGTQQVVLKADRAHFRELTSDAAVLVGRKTLEDFPGGKPLKGRNNIVVTRRDVEIEGAEVVHSTEEALRAASKYDRCLCIGGASIFRQFLPYTEKIFITKIDLTPESDSYFPNLDEDPDWECTEQSPDMEEDGTVFRFCTYERR